MKPKSNAAIIRSIRSKHKKISKASSAQAIERKIVEIKTASTKRSAENSISILFSHHA